MHIDVAAMGRALVPMRRTLGSIQQTRSSHVQTAVLARARKLL